MKDYSEMDIEAFIDGIKADDFSDKYGNNLFAIGESVSETEIEALEVFHARSFPEAYKEFLRLYGRAKYFRTLFLEPKEMREFGWDAGEMEGYVPFAKDLFGLGYAFNWDMKIERYRPKPYAHALVADSFEEWLEIHHDYMQKVALGEDVKDHPYYPAAYQLRDSKARIKTMVKERDKRWWQFWK